MSHLCFVGMMGSGKTTVAQISSQKMGVEYVDSDELITDRTGMNIDELIDSNGEKYFRDLEVEVMKEILINPKITAVATGGGVVLNENIRKLMKENSIVIWLKVSPETLEERISIKQDEGVQAAKLESRPVLRDALARNIDILQVLKEMQAERDDLYREVANLILDGEVLGPAKLADMAIRYFDYHTAADKR